MTVKFRVQDHLPPILPNNPISSLKKAVGLYGGAPQGRARGLGFGVAVSVVINPAPCGLPVSKGADHWGGAATTQYWLDHEAHFLMLVPTQLLPDGAFPAAALLPRLTY